MVMKNLSNMRTIVDMKKNRKRKRRQIMGNRVLVDLILLLLHRRLNQGDQFQVRISLTKKSSTLHHLIVQDLAVRNTSTKGK